MAPTWIPLCRTMQVYCEAYFTAIERWRLYTNDQVLTNRINVIETADKIFMEYSQNKDETYEFDLVYDNQEEPLLPEVIPSQGRDYVVGGDTAAFSQAKKFVAPHIFNRAGLFFQNFLLKQIAGHSDAFLETANIETRKSIIACIDKLLRLSEDAGKARFIYRQLTVDGAPTKFRTYPMHPLGDQASQFCAFLIQNSLQDNPNKRKLESNTNPGLSVSGMKSANGQQKANKKQKNNAGEAVSTTKKRNSSGGGKRSSSRDAEEEDAESGSESSVDEKDLIEVEEEEVDNWITTHESVGTKVAAYFAAPTGRGKQLYEGSVTRYAPPSKPKAHDQLYHILWADGDEEDYDQKQYDKAVQRYVDNFGWLTSGHEAIGLRVAAYFEIPVKERSKKTVNTLFRGKVVRVLPAGVTGNATALYRINWEDGDEEDYDDEDLAHGQALFAELIETKIPSSPTPVAPAKKKETVTPAPSSSSAAPLPSLERNDSLVSTAEEQGVSALDLEEEEEEVLMEVVDDELEEEVSKLINDDQQQLHHHQQTHVAETVAEPATETASATETQVASEEAVPEPEPVKAAKEVEKEEEEEEVVFVSSTPASPATKKGGRGGSKKTTGTTTTTTAAAVSPARVTRKTASSSSTPTATEKTKSKPTAAPKEKKEKAASSSSSSSAKKEAKKKPKVEDDDEDDDGDWTTDHPSINTQVAAYFPVPVGKSKRHKMQLFVGKVTKYAPETKKGKKDQLYHILFEDGDEQDYEEKEYRSAVALFEEKGKEKQQQAEGEGGEEEAEEETKKEKKGGKKTSSSSSSNSGGDSKKKTAGKQQEEEADDSHDQRDHHHSSNGAAATSSYSQVETQPLPDHLNDGEVTAGEEEEEEQKVANPGDSQEEPKVNLESIIPDYASEE